MTREEFKVLAKAMKAVYAQQTFLPDQNAFDVWFAMLKDIPYEVGELAVQKHMLTEKFPPTIADIRAKASGITACPENEMTELEAWALVHKAICRSNYYSEEEFKKLPEACQIAVGSPANLREWAMMDSDQVATVEQSHFIRNYRTAVQRMKDEAKLPARINRMIAEMQEKYMGIEEKNANVPQIGTTATEREHTGVPMPEHLKRQVEQMRRKERVT